MGAKLFLKKVGGFLSKNWLPIAIVLVALISFGILGKIIAKARTWLRVATGSEPAKDWNLQASVMHDALKTTIFDWFVNFPVVKAIIDHLESTNEFLELSKRYALKYGKDLRTDLKQDLSESQYAQLQYK
jgi:hypothetical protein